MGSRKKSLAFEWRLVDGIIDKRYEGHGWASEAMQALLEMET